MLLQGLTGCTCSAQVRQVSGVLHPDSELMLQGIVQAVACVGFMVTNQKCILHYRAQSIECDVTW